MIKKTLRLKKKITPTHYPLINFGLFLAKYHTVGISDLLDHYFLHSKYKNKAGTQNKNHFKNLTVLKGFFCNFKSFYLRCENG